MIDLLVESQAAEFIKTQRASLRDSLKLDLNFSINSIYLLDYIYEKNLILLGKDSLQFKEFILNLTSYIGITIYNYWEKAFQFKPKLQITELPKAGIQLKLEEGPMIVYEPVVVDLLSSINDFINNNKAFAYTEIIPLGLEKHKISYYSLGILFGISPYLKGSWSKFKKEELGIIFSLLCNTIYKDYVIDFNTKLSTKHQILEDLYNPHLIFPPLGFEDSIIGMRPTYALIKSVQRNNLRNEELIKIGATLIESYNILHASLGFIILANLKPLAFELMLTEFAMTYPILVNRLKAAYNLFSKEITKQADWTVLGKKNNIEDKTNSIANLEKEIQFGLSPYINCPDLSLTQDKKFRLYFEAIDLGLIPEAIKIGETIESNNNSFLLQQSSNYLEVLDFKAVRKILSNIPLNNLTQKELENFLLVKGLLELRELKNIDINLLNTVISSKITPSIKIKKFILLYLSQTKHLTTTDLDSRLLNERNLSTDVISILNHKYKIVNEKFNLFRSNLGLANWTTNLVFNFKDQVN